ncbi:MAG: hypothetical protein AB7I52_10590 [Rhizobiaceae bacterium]
MFMAIEQFGTMQMRHASRFAHRMRAAPQIALAIILLAGVRLLRWLPLLAAVCIALALIATMLRD